MATLFFDIVFMFYCKSLRRLLETTRDKFVMGYVLSKLLWFWTPPDYDVPDGATGLTPREKDIIQRTWKLVRADVKGNGVKLFLKYFELHPDYQKLFKAFADVPKDKLPANGKLLGHATSVMYALNSIIDNLEDPVCLVELLHKVGSSHVPRNVTRKHFENLAEVVVIVLEEALGNGVMDAKAKEAWTKTLNVANQVIFKSLEEEYSSFIDSSNMF